jgi:hypothetical protein
LEQVCPAWIDLADVTIRPGGRWVSASDYQLFAREVLKTNVRVFRDGFGQDLWHVQGPQQVPAEVGFRFGTATIAPVRLLEMVMNNRVITVETSDDDGLVSHDPAATATARAKAGALIEAFAKWIMDDPERKTRLEQTYNQLFNSHVRADYGLFGGGLALRGKASTFTPRAHQLDAVARVLHSPAVLLDHAVGAGKTGAIIMAAHELRAAQLARKPWVVVPNQLVEQWANQWRAWYPLAKVLAIPTGVKATERYQWVARAAVGDWDAVICPVSVFSLIKIDPLRAASWLQEEITELQAQLLLETESSSKGRQGKAKAIARRIKQAEKAYLEATSGKDPGVTWEQTGCDYLFVDEAHLFKNLARASDYADLSASGSDRARDLDHKLRSMRETRAQTGRSGGVVTFATGTPMSNSIGERWVMAHYLRPDLLEQAGMATVDGWAAVFTKPGERAEIGPDGRSWRMVSRVREFVNTPELRAFEEQFTSTVLPSQLAASLPRLATGARQVVSRQPSPKVTEYVDDLAVRAQNLPDDPRVDNLLKITTDGRMVALDGRLRGLPKDDDGGRVRQVAQQIWRIHQTHQHNTYLRADGSVSPVKGGFQLVFCDKSTPDGSGKWNVYTQLRDELVELGMDKAEVRFIHEAKDDLARASLFAQAREGTVKVLVGSTEKLGTGVNVQTRCVALHHLDCPWRASDLEQREGRIVRQGNQNPEVEVLAYVTERTYDAVLWQVVARKAANTLAMRQGNADARQLSVDDADLTVTAAMAQAVAVGDDRLVRRAELIGLVGQLEALERSEAAAKATLRTKIGRFQARLAQLDTYLTQLQKLTQLVRPTAGKQFRWLAADGAVITSRADAGQRLIEQVNMAKRDVVQPLGMLGGLQIVRLCGRKGSNQVLQLGGCDLLQVVVPPDQWPTSSVGLVRRLENQLDGLDELISQTSSEQTQLTLALAQARQALQTAGTGEWGAQLVEARSELAELDRALGQTGRQVGCTPVDTGALVAREQTGGLLPEAVSKSTVMTGDLVEDDNKNVFVVDKTGEEEVVLRDQNGQTCVWVKDYYTLVARAETNLSALEQLASKPGWQTVTQNRWKQLRAAKTLVSTVNKDGAIVSGVLVSQRFSTDPDSSAYWRPEQWLVDTGEELVPIEETVVLMKTDPAAGTLWAFRSIPPGVRVTFSTDPDLVPVGSLALPDYGFLTPQGEVQYFEYGKHNCVGVHTEPDGLLLSQTQGRQLYGPSWPVSQVGALRRGDLVNVETLDPKSQKVGVATILRVSGGSSMIEFDYLLEGETSAGRVKRKYNTPIEISRPQAGLTELELYLLQTPQASRLTELGDLSTDLEGKQVIIDKPAYGIWQGRVVRALAAEAPGRYGSLLILNQHDLKQWVDLQADSLVVLPPAGDDSFNQKGSYAKRCHRQLNLPDQKVSSAAGAVAGEVVSSGQPANITPPAYLPLNHAPAANLMMTG